MTTVRPIVAALDGFESSKAALRWAIHQAKLTGAVVDAVTIDTDVVVRPRVVEGQAGPVLVEAAEGADLLVVGNRGHGGLAESLLGSVGRKLMPRLAKSS